jgi:hypothetical protein
LVKPLYLTPALVHGNRVRITYRIANRWDEKLDRRKSRELVNFTVRPSTHEIIKWLARFVKNDKYPYGNSTGRVVDSMIRRFWASHLIKGEYPPKKWSTLDIFKAMLAEVKKGAASNYLHVFQYPDLLSRPYRGQLLDYLAYYYYKYEGKKGKGL